MANLRDVPYKTPPLGTNNLISPTWAAFFRDLFVRAGGNSSYSNAELANLISGGLSTDVSSLQSQVTSLSSSLTALQATVNGLGQEPVA